MKRHCNLYPKVIAFENLQLAFRRAFQGCATSQESQKFYFRLEPELLLLQHQLKTGLYIPGEYHHFTVYDPKERLISVAPFRDRVVHHAIVNILEPIYERSFIHDSYATRKNKGTHQAILRAQNFLRQNSWYLRLDIQRYFETMGHQILYSILFRKIKDPWLLGLLLRIIQSVPWERGVPIGNLTSQFFGNVYLDPLDHYLKEQLQCRFYVRYMDDMVIFDSDPGKLKVIRDQIREFVEKKLALRLKDKAVYLNRRENGLSFVGCRIFPRYLRLKSQSKKRSLRRLKEQQNRYREGVLAEDRLVASTASILGHWAFFNTKRLQCSLAQTSLFWQEPG